MNTLPPCPICRKAAVNKFEPFCSNRCKMIDLNHWFGETYVIPVAETSDEDLEIPLDPNGDL